jgi:hypothetical protein
MSLSKEKQTKTKNTHHHTMLTPAEEQAFDHERAPFYGKNFDCIHADKRCYRDFFFRIGF